VGAAREATVELLLLDLYRPETFLPLACLLNDAIGISESESVDWGDPDVPSSSFRSPSSSLFLCLPSTLDKGLGAVILCCDKNVGVIKAGRKFASSSLQCPAVPALPTSLSFPEDESESSKGPAPTR